MPVVEWDGVPLFGGKTIVISGAAFKGRPKSPNLSNFKSGDNAKPPAFL